MKKKRVRLHSHTPLKRCGFAFALALALLLHMASTQAWATGLPPAPKASGLPRAQKASGLPPAPKASGPTEKASTLKNPCTTKGASLTGSFAVDPCLKTEDNLNIEFVKKYHGGQQVTQHLEKWWTEQFLPSLISMTAQLSASLEDQAVKIGAMMDSQNVTRAARTQQEQELKTKLSLQPSELSCVPASHSTAMAEATTITDKLTQGFKTDMAKRSNNAKGSEAEDGPAAEQKIRFQEYCDEFHDPTNNNGVSACPDPTTPGRIPNGDIAIENLLFKDTIEMGNPPEYRASLALLKNLIEPTLQQKIPEKIVKTPTGQEWILRKQHLDSTRNIAADTVSSILARRAAIPSGDAGAPPPPPPPPVPIPGGSAGSFEDFRAAVAISESSGNYGAKNKIGCLGAYQFCSSTLVTLGCKTSSGAWTGTCGGVSGINSEADFLASKPAQDGAFAQNNNRNWRYVQNKGLTSHIGTTVGGTLVTPSGMLGAMHLGGPGGLKKYLDSGGAYNPGDVLGTQISDYMKKFQGYDTPFDSRSFPGNGGSGMTSTPHKSVAQTIREIREKAGIDPALISNNPSYNEIMQALTKERFYDPEYFIRMHQNMGAIKQEQTAVNAYISLQLQDIYKLQEQINALLAARTALKLNAKPLPNRIESAPLTPK